MTSGANWETKLRFPLTVVIDKVASFIVDRCGNWEWATTNPHDTNTVPRMCFVVYFLSWKEKKVGFLENHAMCARTCMFVKFNFCISWLVFMKCGTNLMLYECTPASWFIRVISPKILDDAEVIYDNTPCGPVGINDDKWKTVIRRCKIWCTQIINTHTLHVC